MAIEPETSTERKKLADVLDMMKRQDPTFRARENEETGQTLISGMGELHLEVIKHRLLRDSGSTFAFTSRASATAKRSAGGDGTGKCHRSIAGKTLSATSTSAWSQTAPRLNPFGPCAPAPRNRC